MADAVGTKTATQCKNYFSNYRERLPGQERLPPTPAPPPVVGVRHAIGGPVAEPEPDEAEANIKKPKPLREKKGKAAGKKGDRNAVDDDAADVRLAGAAAAVREAARAAAFKAATVHAIAAARAARTLAPKLAAATETVAPKRPLSQKLGVAPTPPLASIAAAMVGFSPPPPAAASPMFAAAVEHAAMVAAVKAEPEASCPEPSMPPPTSQARL